MPTDIVMPQMGESIFEGTITKWLKKPGDKVQRDEPLFEISTDKVDAEIPAPATGVLQEIRVPEGTTVQVNSVVGTIAAEGEAASAAKTTTAPATATATGPATGSATGSTTESKPVPAASAAAAAASTSASSAPAAQLPEAAVGQAEEGEEASDVRSSPLVRKLARENNVNLSQVSGTGTGGRVTKQDVMAFLEKPVAAASSPAAASSAPAPRSAAPSATNPSAPAPSAPAPRSTPPAPAAFSGDVVPMTQMRKIIAQRMIESRRTSAHVHCMFQVDLTRIAHLRNKLKNSFEQRNGARLTFMPFFVRAAIIGLQQFPICNASVEGDNIRYHRNVNVGIAVALDWGLIVPVLKNAGEMNFLGLQRGIADLGERSRSKKLMPQEVEGSTFTVTNPGQFGAVFGLPIINQPNVAIMGVGGITKIPMVMTDKEGNDSISIRSVVNLTLGYDHRVIDGAVADQFMVVVKKALENWGEEIG